MRAARDGALSAVGLLIIALATFDRLIYTATTEETRASVMRDTTNTAPFLYRNLKNSDQELKPGAALWM